jgi:hypothetical protein
VIRILDWLQRHPGRAWGIVLTYYVAVVLSHDLVQRPALDLQYAFGIERIHYIILGLLLIALAVVAGILRGRLQTHPARGPMLRTGVILLIWTSLVFSWVLVRSIESIHFVQYLLLTLALLTLRKNLVEAILIATICGLLDEAWQYFYLHPRQPYFDFNDVIMNTTGVLMGAWVFSLYRPSLSGQGDWSNTTQHGLALRALRGWGLALVLVLGLMGAGVFTVYNAESSIALHRRVPPTAEKPVKYFRTNKWGNSSFRIHPWLGIGFLFGLPLAVLAIPGFRLPPRKDDP